MITIIDYGMGNLRSVQKAIESIGHDAEVTCDPERVRRASKVVLPGVGAFADAVAELNRTGLGEAFCEAVRAGKPCLGVCLGLQLLFDVSEEDGEHRGLGLLPGRVVRFKAAPGLKVPHMGWNPLRVVRDAPLLRGLGPDPSVYFVHSYHAAPDRPEDVAAEADHGGAFPAMVWRENLQACQFHPEKSQKVGLAMYANFVALQNGGAVMPTFVHLAPESRVALIRRNGLSRRRKAFGPTPAGLFAMPVTRNFYVSHQWLRELKRRNQGALAGIYFRITDDEPVWVGHYGQAHRLMTAAEASAEFTGSENREGWEVIIPRRIAAKEIHRVRSLPQVVGWRFFPGAKGKKPFCVCRFRTRGEYGAVRLRTRLGSPGD